MAERKAVFFDVDNTLWDFRNYIPDSTARAIRQLRKNGHLALICTGRTRGFVRNPALLDLGFDGIVSGCGTLLEFGGETLFYHRIEPDVAVRTVETVRSYGFKPILEGREYLYYHAQDFDRDLYGDKLKRDLGEYLLDIDEHWGRWEISKLACDTEGCDQAAGLAALAADYKPLVHNHKVIELVPRGFDKGVGLRRLCALIGHPQEDTVAFGDSVNDLEMFHASGYSVCMGNGSEQAKSTADYVTDSLDRDGVWNACVHLGLI